MREMFQSIEWDRPTWYFGLTPRHILTCKVLGWVIAIVWILIRDGGAGI